MNKDYTILCVDDDENFLVQLESIFADYTVFKATCMDDALSIIDRNDINTVLLDISLNGEDGLDGLNLIKKRNSFIDVVMVTGHRDTEYIVKAIQSGASDYVLKPVDQGALLACVEKSKQSKKEKEKYNALLCELNSADIASRIVGRSAELSKILNIAKKVKGHHRANILIEGESGTGKELLARYIHRLEENTRRPFIAINCAAIPDNLIESELFGHEKGAFTGAIGKKIGKFVLADKGDIFLDEISSLKPDLQAKLLRVFQEKEFCPLGGNDPVKSDFRVIAATNENLEELVNSEKFRLDLYHRMKIVNLYMPPLRDRKDDIEELAQHFLRKYSDGKRGLKIADKAIAILKEYSWPGNVRELENIIHRAIVLAEGYMLSEKDFSHLLTPSSACINEGQSTPFIQLFSEISPKLSGNVMPLKDYVMKAETEYLKEVLDLKAGNKDEAAVSLKMSRSSFYSKLKQCGFLT
ncbi:MAG: sigma-54 dependent transcriptional regulator [Pseudomonadota bacterium]